MPWNEPGGNGKDPWGKRPDGDGPPDLDEVVRKMQDRIGGFFGGGRRGDNSGRGSGSPAVTFAFVLIGIVLYLAYDTSYIIQPAERGVVLQFGAYSETIEPGYSWQLPRPFEYVIKVDVDQIRTISHEASMLTRDENIVAIELAVQYKIGDVTEYLFNVRGPDSILRRAVETSVREVIGTSEMDFVLTTGRDEVAQRGKQAIQKILSDQKTGLLIDSVNIQAAKPPEEVKSAFDDAIKAREDEVRLINEAQAYSNEIVPKARGGAARQREEATAYKEKVVAEAQGETERFLKLLAEYEKAPDVTRERLYLDALEDVMSGSTKVLMDSSGSNNILYLPLDQIMNRAVERQPAAQSYGNDGGAPPPAADARTRSDYRTRGSR